MKKIFKTLFLFINLFAFVLLGLVSTKATTTLANTIDVQLEQQENKANNKIRYIATISNVEDLSYIDDIEITFTLSKEGEADRTAKRNITSVYTSVAGTNGKPEVDNTYYALFQVNNTDGYKGYTLGATFKFTYSDSSFENTNSITYDIPEVYHVVSSGSGSFENSSSIEELYTADSIENGNIFHAWNWSMSTIEANLDDIKAAGYTTIQTSPMQPQKDYYSTDTQEQWWKVYQPLGFSIATKNNQLGTKTDLTSMVATAHTKGLKVIVDVVSNHLAGSSTQLDAGVQEYEPTIYGTNGNLSGGALLHSNTGIGADNSHNVTDGNIGLPDLNTGNDHVQQRVLSLLKEYIDCGVDGFRFDAAKHIETDNQGEPCGYSSFWPTVINGATQYATSKGKDTPYYYGEILDTCGDSRSFAWYTKYMDVTDNKTGNDVRDSFGSGTATSASSFNTGCTADQVVLWGESHDTFANEWHETTFVSQTVIDKAYAYSAARGKAKSLYLARPCADNQFGYVDTNNQNKLKITCPVVLGVKGDWNAFKSAQITAVNKFHNYWGTAAEWNAANDGFSQVVRYNNSESGMVLINAGSGTSVSNVTVPTAMKDGSYTDLVTGNTFTVSGSKVSGTMASCGIAVLVDANAASGEVSISSAAPATFYTDTMTASYTIKNATSATMTVDGDTFDITSGAEITFGATLSVGESITVSITANGTTETFTYTKVEAPETYKVYFEKPEGWTNLYAHAWGGTATATTWPGIQLTAQNDNYFFEYEEGAYAYVVFTDGTNKTEDIALTGANATYSLDDDTSVIYFANNLNWSTVNAYMWYSDEAHNADWPGAALTLDQASGYYKVSIGSYTKAIFNNGSVQTADITINNSNGAAVYKLATTDNQGHYTVDVALKVKVGTTCDHVYSAPVWTWNEYSSATATFTCTECGHEKTVNAIITNEVTLEPTETETGIRTYTATITFKGQNYTNTKNETIPTLETVIEVPAVAATCGQAGNSRYYIKGNKYYSDAECENEITLASTIIPATGEHTIAPGVYSVTDGITCSVCHEAVDYNVDTTTVYYLVNSTWGDNWNVRSNIYYYTGSAEMDWPGYQMTKEGTVTYKGSTYTVYSYTFASGRLTDYEKVIFNSGTSGNAQNSNGTLVLSGVNCYINDYDSNFEATEFIYVPESN